MLDWGVKERRVACIFAKWTVFENGVIDGAYLFSGPFGTEVHLICCLHGHWLVRELSAARAENPAHRKGQHRCYRRVRTLNTEIAGRGGAGVISPCKIRTSARCMRTRCNCPNAG